MPPAAREIGLNLADYDRVVADPATEAALDATLDWARTVSSGLPLAWVGDRLVTNLTPDNLEIAFRRAQRSAAGRR